MTNWTEFYSDMEEKNDLLELYHSQGKRLRHDDYLDEQEKPTDGGSGRLIFTDEQTINIQPITDESELLEKLNANTISFEEVKQLLKIQYGQL